MEIAAYGWDHDAWAGGFYPEDLPPEWRLGFYANAFRAVVVPARAWLALNAGAVAAWAEDVDRDFRFYLQLPDQADPEACAASAAGFGGRLGGFLSAAAPAAAEAYQARLGRLGPVCRLVAEGPARGPGPLAAVRCPRGKPHPRELRAFIEALGKAAADGPAILLFDDDPSVPDAMAEARTMIELMGL